MGNFRKSAVTEVRSEIDDLDLSRTTSQSDVLRVKVVRVSTVARPCERLHQPCQVDGERPYLARELVQRTGLSRDAARTSAGVTKESMSQPVPLLERELKLGLKSRSELARVSEVA